jgi:hypothetical protein
MDLRKKLDYLEQQLGSIFAHEGDVAELADAAKAIKGRVDHHLAAAKQRRKAAAKPSDPSAATH